VHDETPLFVVLQLKVGQHLSSLPASPMLFAEDGVDPKGGRDQEFLRLIDARKPAESLATPLLHDRRVEVALRNDRSGRLGRRAEDGLGGRRPASAP
jgi:hypothetical protein